MNKRLEKVGALETRIIEECIEVTVECMAVAKTLCKSQRFGLFNAPAHQLFLSRHPKRSAKLTKPNWMKLKEEIGDLEHRLREMKKLIQLIEGQP